MYTFKIKLSLVDIQNKKEKKNKKRISKEKETPVEFILYPACVQKKNDTL